METETHQDPTHTKMARAGTRRALDRGLERSNDRWVAGRTIERSVSIEVDCEVGDIDEGGYPLVRVRVRESERESARGGETSGTRVRIRRLDLASAASRRDPRAKTTVHGRERVCGWCFVPSDAEGESPRERMRCTRLGVEVLIREVLIHEVLIHEMRSKAKPPLPSTSGRGDSQSLCLSAMGTITETKQSRVTTGTER
jgi:hypothetical protein